MAEEDMAGEYTRGLIKGVPVALGYLSVSFTFGIIAVELGMSPLSATFTSLSNLTSAGQFAGIQLIAEGASLLELAVTTFIINMRYMLMSLALAQKLDESTGVLPRLIFGFGVTDEIFAISIVEGKKLTSSFMYGLMTLPIIGWTAGTALGAAAKGLLPSAVSAAMNIALYAMFTAIVIPPARKSRAVLFAVLTAAFIMCILTYVSFFSPLSSGIKAIITAVAAAVAAALLFPDEEEKNAKAALEE